MLAIEKELGYEEWKPKIIVKQDIEDLVPFEIVFPEPPPLHEFINYGKKASEQFFVREEIPEWVHKLNRKKREEANAIVKQNDYMAQWINSQWEKRTNGVFMFINGKPLFIPGKYWWYLNYYWQNTERGVDLGDFRYPDLEWFWIWCLFVLPNPNIYGTIDFTMRRDGKTARAFGEDLEEISKTANVKAGGQSKTDKDAKDTFQEFIVEPWRRLPWYFSPKFDNKTYPSREINFRSSSVAGDDMDASILADAVSDELGSSIEVRSTVKNAFDGRKLRRYTLDEAGKVEEMDVYEAWRVHKQCLRIGQKLVGKAKITTTVEMLSKLGMGPFFQIWDESDRTKLTKLFQTVSGLVPIFKPGYEAYIYDQYGFPIVNTPTEEQAEYRKQVLISENRLEEVKLDYHKKGGKELLEIEADTFTNPSKKQAFIRMYPPSIRIARRSDGKDCHFSAHVEAIDQRLDELRYGEGEYVGNLEWKNNVRFSEVEWKPCQHKFSNEKDSRGHLMGCPHCKWRFFYLPFQYANNVIEKNGRLYPGNKGRIMTSADTFKYDSTEGTRKSMATSHGYMEFDLEIDGDKEDSMQWVTDDFLYEYASRPPSKRIFGEDMIKTVHWLGAEMFPEINVPFVWDYFVEHGYENFLKFRKIFKKDSSDGKIKVQEAVNPGITTLGDAIKDPMFSAAEVFLEKNIRRTKARRFLQDCRDVDYKKLSPFDSFISGSQVLYARSMAVRPKKKEKENKPYDLGSLMEFRVAGE